MQGHDRHFGLRILAGIVHDQGHVFEEPLQVFKPFQGLDQFLEVLQTPRCFGRLVVLPMGGVATFIQDDLGQFHMGQTRRAIIDTGRGTTIVQHRIVIQSDFDPRAAQFRVPAINTFNQRPQCGAALALDQPLFNGDPRAFDERDTVGACRNLNRLLGLVAEAPFRRVHNPLKRQIIVRGHHDPEIGHRISDLHPLVEPRATDHAIWQSDGQKPILKRPHLVRGADEDCHFVQSDGPHATGAALCGFDLFPDPARLLLAVPMTDQAHLFAVVLVGPKGLAQPPLIARDDAGSCSQDMRGGAVVLLKPHHMRAGKVGLEPQDIAHLCPAPAIDRLIIIAHAADILVPLGQQAQPEILGHVGILVFVHEDVAEPALVLFQNIAVGLKDRHDMQQKVAKVAGVQFDQPLLVLRVKLDTFVIVRPAVGGRHFVRRQRSVFPPVDDGTELPRRPAFVVDIGGADQLFEQPQLVVSVENGEVGLEASQFRMAAQQLDADRVERAKPWHPFDRLAEHAADPVFHLARGLVGKGHREDFIGSCPTCVQQMHHACGQRPRFAGARPRQHQDRPVHLLNGGTLRGVQPLQIGLRSRGHGPGGQGCCPFKGVHIVKTAHALNLTGSGPKEKPCSRDVPSALCRWKTTRSRRPGRTNRYALRGSCQSARPL
mmetsp:Transcript_29177/g.56349  ORF Transcript_29177/g.56349 Transcript_29177/m.56349 type:complete len:659 (+) Transcript_29177:738-2714(+)